MKNLKALSSLRLLKQKPEPAKTSPRQQTWTTTSNDECQMYDEHQIPLVHSPPTLDLSKHKLSRSDDSREFSQKDHSEEILMVFHRTEL